MDETRQLLKIFGVAVTDFEAEAEKPKVSRNNSPPAPTKPKLRAT